MCFGPSKEEKKAAAEQRVEADAAEQKVKEVSATQKREDIQEAIESSTERRGGMRGGAGRRSLMRAGGQGFLGRFL
jgi:hypothetical protein